MSESVLLPRSAAGRPVPPGAGGVPAPRPGLPRRGRGSGRDLRRTRLRDRRRRGGRGWRCVELVAVGEPIPVPEPPCSLVLATAVPKGDRFDWLVEKATELGVDRLIPTSPSVRSSSPAARSSTACAGRSSRHRNNAGGPGSWSWRSRWNGPAWWRISGRRQVPGGSRGRPRIGLADDQPGPRGGAGGRARGRPDSSGTELAVRSGWLRIRLGYNILRVETADWPAVRPCSPRVPEEQA